jgi:hypothetical protein
MMAKPMIINAKPEIIAVCFSFVKCPMNAKTKIRMKKTIPRIPVSVSPITRNAIASRIMMIPPMRLRRNPVIGFVLGCVVYLSLPCGFSPRTRRRARQSLAC